ncbi:hypothetical protein B0H63DRAFT_446085 [Podospora didyma]|uniref:Uncharacterized protein n=1 Tax=Podospora didyma TaxID=330526 RepID=A0AAE0NY97_9PEZI|nr:hypothetical protein B0H63DRAFT_446085 [Podospora didyma]
MSTATTGTDNGDKQDGIQLSHSTKIHTLFRISISALFIAWSCALGWVLVFLSRVSLSGLFFGAACRPDGSFSPFGDDYRWWSKDGFFQITIGFGTLTFTEAKAIDVAWDIIVSRLGQALMAYISWRTFADYVATSMITHSVTYSSFWVIFLHKEPSLTSVLRLIRDLLPDFVKTAISESLVNKNPDISKYGLHNRTTGATTWGNMTLIPALNISAFYFLSLPDRKATGKIPTQNSKNRAYSAYGHTYSLGYIKANGTCQPITDDKPCTAGSPPDAESCGTQQYLWGFSYIQLFINNLLLILWTVGMFIMWQKAHFQLPLHGYPEVPRGWRAIKELSRSLEAEMASNKIDFDALTDRELTRQIRKHLNGGSVLFQQGSLERPGHSFSKTITLSLHQVRILLQVAYTSTHTCTLSVVLAEGVA